MHQEILDPALRVNTSGRRWKRIRLPAGLFVLGVILAIAFFRGPDSGGGEAVAPAFLEVWTVSAEQERPVEGVEVRVLLSSGEELMSRYTGPDGQARWEHGGGDLVVRVEDPQGRYFPQEQKLGKPGEAILFKLREGVSAVLDVNSAGPICISADLAPQPLELPWSQLDEQPRPEAARLSMPVRAEVEVWPMEGAVIRSVTSADGHLDLEPLPPGDVKLLISAEGHVRTVLDFTLVYGKNRLGQVVLQPGGTTLKGRLRIREEATAVSFRFEGVSVKVSTPVDGNFEITGLPAGRGTLLGWNGDRELFRLPVDVKGAILDLGEIDPDLVAATR